jgi:tetratricopeptide (TPR) repeat protein
MKLQDRFLRDLQLFMLFVNPRERIPVTTNLFFVAVVQQRLAKDHGLNARLFNRDAFDSVRRHSTLEGLPPRGERRARALLKLADVEQSAARNYDALKLLIENVDVFENVRHVVVKGSYHNELAMTFEEIAVADRRPDYFQLALTEYKAAEQQFKLAKNHINRASVKNNEAVVLSKIGPFKEAHKHLDQAREITVRYKDRTRTAMIDSTRAELLITEGRFKDAEAVARRAATALEKPDTDVGLQMH